MGSGYCSGGPSIPPDEPLLEASLELLAPKTVFLLAIALVEKRSKLQALVFGPKYQGSVVMLNFSSELLRKILSGTFPKVEPSLLLLARPKQTVYTRWNPW